ncbi:MAG TPA: hypothetical protein DCE42_13190 [Myxococcales bacterium]|nr:hypothetical protein [Myxococcales bacterium]
MSFQQGKSDKVYEIELCEVNTQQYVVNFRYGRRGHRLRDGTRTKAPVELDKGQAAFDKLVQEKIRKGYVETTEYLETDYATLLGREATPEEVVSEEPVADEVVSVDEVVPPSLQTPPSEENADVSERVVHPGRGASSREEAVLQWLDFYLTAQPGERGKWSLSSVIRRAGQLRIADATPKLCRLLQSRFRVQYDVAWALSRCGGEQAIEALRRLASMPLKTSLARVAYAGLSHLLQAQPVAFDEWTVQRNQQLPSTLRELVNNGDLEGGVQCAHQLLEEEETTPSVFVLFLTAGKELRGALCRSMKQYKLQGHSMQCLREIYDAAWLLGDVDSIACLFGLFDTKDDIPYSTRGVKTFRKHLWKQLAREREEHDGERVVLSMLSMATDEAFQDAAGGSLSRLVTETSMSSLWQACSQEDVLMLWTDAQSELVRKMAYERLEAVGFLKQSPDAYSYQHLQCMLSSIYDAPRELGFSMAKERAGDASIMGIIATSPDENAQEFVSDWLLENVKSLKELPDRQIMKFVRSQALLGAFMLHKSAKVRALGDVFFGVAVLGPTKERSLCRMLIGALLARSSGKKGAEIACIEMMVKHFSRTLRVLSLELVLALLQHKHLHKQILGMKMLEGRVPSSITDEVWIHAAGLQEEEALEVFLRLLRQWSDSSIAERQELLVKIAHTSTHTAIKLEVRKLLQRALSSPHQHAHFAANLIMHITS